MNFNRELRKLENTIVDIEKLAIRGKLRRVERLGCSFIHFFPTNIDH